MELRVSAGDEAVDAIAEVFRTHGAHGIAIHVNAQEGPEEGMVRADMVSTVAAYLPANPPVEGTLDSIQRSLWHLSAFDLAPISPLTHSLVQEEDWANAWKEHYHPVRIGRILIKPSWRTVEEADDDVVIELDPGMAFGTGLHPTTRMMLELTEQLTVPGSNVLDVGTGSGILGIAAIKLGAKRVLAIDVEDVACRVARENVERNGVASAVSVRHGTLPELSDIGSFDLVLANIIASVIAELAPALRAVLTPTGRLAVSGIIADRANLVREAFAASDLNIIEEKTSGDWICYVASAA